jgi:hypothetical protein
MAYTTIDDPTIYFNTKLYTGNGSTQSITGVNFQPDWVWIKDRGNATNHMVFDSVRGTGKELHTQNTDTETTQSNTLTAFGSDGFSLGSHADVNDSSDTYVAWNWKKTATAGFDIVSYSGNGSSRTISHSLSAVPKLIILKNRSEAFDWRTYTTVIDGSMDYVFLNKTDAKSDDSVSVPTSSVFSLDNSNQTNKNGNNFIAYLFADVKGYSKFGSYTGNGDADGTFVYTGFRASFVMCKRSSGTGNWQMFDSKREGYNVDNDGLQANLSNAEATDDDLDILSNGFKLRGSGNDLNGSGETYIYMAFAESPFTNSNGVPNNAR